MWRRQVEASSADAEGTDRFRFASYVTSSFRKWALVVLRRSLLAAIVTVVRVASRKSAAPSSVASTTSAESRSPKQSEPTPALPEPPRAAVSVAPAGVAAPSAPIPHKGKDKKAKTQDPGFFRDPGF